MKFIPGTAVVVCVVGRLVLVIVVLLFWNKVVDSVLVVDVALSLDTTEECSDKNLVTLVKVVCLVITGFPSTVNGFVVDVECSIEGELEFVTRLVIVGVVVDVVLFVNGFVADVVVDVVVVGVVVVGGVVVGVVVVGVVVVEGVAVVGVVVVGVVVVGVVAFLVDFIVVCLVVGFLVITVVGIA